MKEYFVGIVVDTQTVVGVSMIKEHDVLRYETHKILPRSESLDEDVRSLVNSFHHDSPLLGITAVESPVIDIKKVPKSFGIIEARREFIKESEEYMIADPDTYYHQCKVEEGNRHNTLYTVALPKQLVYDLGRASFASGACLELIDYFPYGAKCISKEHQVVHVGNLDDGLYAFAWQGDHLIRWSKNTEGKSEKAFIEEFIGSMAVQEVSLTIYTHGFSDSAIEDVKVFETSYPHATTPTITMCDDVEDLRIATCIGMGYRWLH